MFMYQRRASLIAVLRHNCVRERKVQMFVLVRSRSILFGQPSCNNWPVLVSLCAVFLCAVCPLMLFSELIAM